MVSSKRQLLEQHKISEVSYHWAPTDETVQKSPAYRDRLRHPYSAVGAPWPPGKPYPVSPASERLRRPWERNADVITDTLDKLVQSGGLRIPRGGYIVTRSRGRVIVSRAKG